MRILFLHPNAWINEYSIIIKLKELGHDVFVLEEDRNINSPEKRIEKFFKNENDEIRTFWYNPKKEKKKILTFPVDRIFKRYFNGRNLGHRIWIISDAIKYFNPDVIITTDGFTYSIPASFFKRLTGKKILLMFSYIGGDILDCPEADVGKRRNLVTNWLIKKSIESADILRAVSPLIKKELINFGADEKKIVVIPSHLSIPEDFIQKLIIEKKLIRKKIREKYRIPDNGKVIITLSLNLKGKGIHILGQIWEKIIKKINDCYWLLCGPRSEWFNEKILPIIQPHLDRTIFFTDRLKGIEVFEHFLASDLHINPSICEGLNMATVEASVVGVPTISSEKAGIAYWINEFKAGKVISSPEPSALLNAILEFFNELESNINYEKGCFELAKCFTLEIIAKKIIDKLKNTIQNDNKNEKI